MKAKELCEFLQLEACRRCESQSEHDDARTRSIGARWVLTWKTIPEEERSDANDKRNKAAAAGEPSAIHATGEKKAKARIVLLGYQHPDLGKGLRRALPCKVIWHG